MMITGHRPVAVESLNGEIRLPGYLPGYQGSIAPSLIQMDNGSVIRNLMGATTNASYTKRLWGTLGSSEIIRETLRLRLGAAGYSPLLEVTPTWEQFGELAAPTRHNGGDFWVLYYFAREILTGEKGSFDVYAGSDVTIPGIQAARSSQSGGKLLEIPDFRLKSDRDRYRDDNWQQKPYNVKRGVFNGYKPKADEPGARFTAVMRDLIATSVTYRAYRDWKKVKSNLTNPTDFIPIAEALLHQFPVLQKAYQEAAEIITAHPGTDGARVLSEMLEVGKPAEVLAPDFLRNLKSEVAAYRRQHKIFAPIPLTGYRASALIPLRTAISKIGYPDDKIKFSKVPYDTQQLYCNVTNRYQESGTNNGVIFGRAYYQAAKKHTGILVVGADGPFKTFLNGKEIFCNPKATNPVIEHCSELPVEWQQGRNEIIIALRTNKGRAWGFSIYRKKS